MNQTGATPPFTHTRDVDGPPDCTVWQVGVDGEVSEEYAMGCYRGDDALIATMGPDLARALGDWLRQTAERHVAFDYLPYAEYCNGCSDPIIYGDSGGNGPHLVDWPCRDFVAAERVATAILAGAS